MAKRKKAPGPPPPPPPPPPPLRQHEPGVVRCLGGCDRPFRSPDHCCRRICPACARKAGRDYTPPRGAASVYFQGRRVELDE